MATLNTILKIQLMSCFIWHLMAWCGNLSSHHGFWPETLQWQGGFSHWVRRRLIVIFPLWDLSEWNQTLTQATSAPETLSVSNYITPNKPASQLQPENPSPLPSPYNMQPVCQTPLWNCVFLVPGDQIALLSGRPGNTLLRGLSK